MGCRIETGWQGSLLVLMDYYCRCVIVLSRLWCSFWIVVIVSLYFVLHFHFSFVLPFAVLNTVVGVACVAVGLCMLRNGFGVMNFNHWDFSSGDESERHNRCRHKTKPKVH